MARAADTDDVDGSCFVTKSPAGDQVDALCVSSSTASCLPALPLHRPPPKDLRQVSCSAGPIPSTACSDFSTHAIPHSPTRRHVENGGSHQMSRKSSRNGGGGERERRQRERARERGQYCFNPQHIGLLPHQLP